MSSGAPEDGPSDHETAVEKIKKAAAEIDAQVDRFNDGSTNWKEVLPEYKDAVEELQNALTAADATPGDTCLGKVATAASDLSDAGDAFDFDDWKDAVSKAGTANDDLQVEVTGLDSCGDAPDPEP